MIFGSGIWRRLNYNNKNNMSSGSKRGQWPPNGEGVCMRSEVNMWCMVSYGAIKIGGYLQH